jgi:hypothetical protein
MIEFVHVLRSCVWGARRGRDTVEIQKAPSVTGGALSGGGGSFYRMQPGDDPPVAVVVVVAGAKQSLSIEGGSQMKPAAVNRNLTADTGNVCFPPDLVIRWRSGERPKSTQCSRASRAAGCPLSTSAAVRSNGSCGRAVVGRRLTARPFRMRERKSTPHKPEALINQNCQRVRRNDRPSAVTARSDLRRPPRQTLT